MIINVQTRSTVFNRKYQSKLSIATRCENAFVSYFIQGLHINQNSDSPYLVTKYYIMVTQQHWNMKYISINTYLSIFSTHASKHGEQHNTHENRRHLNLRQAHQIMQCTVGNALTEVFLNNIASVINQVSLFPRAPTRQISSTFPYTECCYSVLAVYRVLPPSSCEMVLN